MAPWSCSAVLSRCALRALLMAVLSAAPLAALAAPAPLVVHDLGRATQTLDGPWQFHTGDNPGWAAPGFDDSSWQALQAGVPWDAQGHWGYTGFAWYRRHIEFAPGTPPDLNLALYLPAVDSACEVYWNGRLVGRIGKVPPHPLWYQNAYGRIGSGTSDVPLGPPQPGVLAIRVWKAPTILFADPEEGGIVDAPRIGSADAIAAFETGITYDWLYGNEFNLAVVFLCTVLSLLCLLMGLRNRMYQRAGNTSLLLWLAVALTFPLEFFLFLDVPGLLPFRWNYGLIAILIGIYEAALWFVLIDLLGLKENRRLVRWTWGVIAVMWAFEILDGGLQLIDWSSMPHRFLPWDIAMTVLAVVAELWGVVVVLFAFRRRHDAARWTLAVCALVANLVQALDDISGMGLRWTHWTLNSYITRPLLSVFGNNLDARTISNTLLLIAILYAAWRYSVEQSRRQNDIEQEYRSAQELQRLLIPEELPTLPGYHLASAYRPAQEVGGDFFQLIPLPGEAALLVIGDVSGKGLHAAMTVALIVGALRSTVETTTDPAEILAALNRRVHGRLRNGFVTCLVLHLNAEGNCRMANAGHLPPFLNGREVALPPALPLGIVPAAEYETAAVRIAPGDHLTLYTDGLPEARNEQGELFGFTRIAAIAHEAAESIASAAQHFGQEDDITVLTLKFAHA